MSQLHISISAEPIFHFGNFAITNSMLTSVIVSVLFFILSVVISTRIDFKKGLKPAQKFSFVAMIEFIIETFYEFVKGVVGPSKARKFFPLIATLFFYILVANWIGLLPGVGSIGLSKPAEVEAIKEEKGLIEPIEERQISTEGLSPQKPEKAVELETESESQDEAEDKEFVPLLRGATADINTTLALALIAMFMVQFYGFQHLGIGYLTKFFNFRSVMGFVVGLLELISELSRIISFAFRLFGNIFAGEVLLSVIAFLVPIIAPLPFLGLEVFVGLIQALVFAMLTLVFINMAITPHEAEH